MPDWLTESLKTYGMAAFPLGLLSWLWWSERTDRKAAQEKYEALLLAQAERATQRAAADFTATQVLAAVAQKASA